MKKVLEELKDLKYNLENPLKIGKGRNSKIYKVTFKGENLILKLYKKDDRKRAEREIIFLNYLKQNKIKNIPYPIKWDISGNWALLTFIDGKSPKEVTKEVIDEALLFQEKIQHATKNSILPEFLYASDSGLNIESHLKNAFSRFFMKYDYLKNSEKSFKEITTWCNKYLLKELKSISDDFYNSELKTQLISLIQEKFLSPSDVGIHNMLINDNGFFFLDFEYAGWDDPHKYLSDWILQPDNILSIDLICEMIKKMNNSEYLPAVNLDILKFLLRIQRIKWCLIILNNLKIEEGMNYKNIKIFKKIQKYYDKSKKTIINFLKFFN